MLKCRVKTSELAETGQIYATNWFPTPFLLPALIFLYLMHTSIMIEVECGIKILKQPEVEMASEISGATYI